MDLAFFESLCGTITQPVLLLQRAPCKHEPVAGPPPPVPEATAGKEFHFDLLPLLETPSAQDGAQSNDSQEMSIDETSFGTQRALPTSAFDTDIHCIYMNTSAKTALGIGDTDASRWQLPYRQCIAFFVF